MIWERFPKFVLGFMPAALVFPFALDRALVTDPKSPLTAVPNIR